MKLGVQSLKLDLTNSCNQSCNFCPYHGVEGEVSDLGKMKVPVEKIDLAIVKKIIEDLDGVLKKVKLSGSGESTLHPDFKEIVELIRGKNLFIKLISNGTTLDCLAEFLNENIDDLVISLHGDETIHDNLVGLRKAYEKVLCGLFKIKNLPAGRLEKINIAYVINGENLDSVVKIVDLSRKINVPVVFYFDFNPQKHKKIDMKLLFSMIKLIRENGFQISPDLDESAILEFFSLDTFVLNPHSCKHVLDEVEIKANGDVCVCRSKVWGNLNETGILNIIESRQRNEFLDLVDKEAKSANGLSTERCDRCCYQNPFSQKYKDK
ncbi:hypothetical protein C0416_01140 [bacterium]|nr:hypothetical protein [bacterium]